MAPEQRMISSPSTWNRSPPLLHLYGHGFLAFEYYAAGQAVGPDGEVEAVAGRVQVTQRRTEPDTVGVVEGHRAHAAGLRVVVVRGVGKTGVPAGAVERRLVRQQLLPLEAAGDDRSFGAVKVVVGKVCVRLNAAQEGDQLGEAPFVVPHGSP